VALLQSSAHLANGPRPHVTELTNHSHSNNWLEDKGSISGINYRNIYERIGEVF